MQALVLDDSRAMRAILSGILGKLGFEVAQAASGREALARLHREPRPSVVLVDWHLPQMDGIEFVRRVRDDDDFAEVRLLMVTTETEIDSVSEALEAGANEFLMKPFTSQMIAQKLEILGVS